MSHVQRRCGGRGCRKAVPEGSRRCSACGGEVRYIARYIGTDHVERAETFRRKIDAETFLTSQEGAKVRGDWIAPERGRESLEAFWSQWRTRAEETGRPSERTLMGYDELWRLYVGPALAQRSLSSITRGDVRELVDAVAERSAWRATDVLKLTRRLLNAALDEEMIVRNPAARVTAPRIEQSEPWVLDPDQVERLAGAVPDRWRAFVLLGAYSSLRWSELVALRVDRIDLLRQRVRVEEKIVEHGHLIRGEPKTRQSRRSVAIPKDVAHEVAEHLRKYPPGPDGLAFTAPEGGVIRRPHFTRLVWKPATTAAGLAGFRFGNLRHTGASLAIAAGANPMLVAARLGHSSTRMVERHYISLFEGLDAEIGKRLGTMRRRAEAETKRLRPSGSAAADGTQTGHRRGTVVPLNREKAEQAV